MNPLTFRLACLATLLLASLVAAQEKAKEKRKESVAITDPAKAGPDFAIQGEYVGDVVLDLADKSKRKAGLQVIALGDRKFDAVLLRGGLPGDGWDKGKKLKLSGVLDEGTARFRDEGEEKISIKDGVATLIDKGKALGQLKKVDRKSPTLGAKPPTDALAKDIVVLFDGTSADQFDGRMTDDKLLMHGATSKRKFQSCALHVEFQLPFMPYARGQGRGNSGVYLQGRYEVQILDSFGLKGDNHECGGVYEVRDPDLNMCFPPLSWQTYDIDFTAAQFDAAGKKTKNAWMLVKLNGVVIHEHLDLPKATLAHPVPEGPEPGPLYLQDHGNPVRFRNIWLVEKK